MYLKFTAQATASREGEVEGGVVLCVLRTRLPSRLPLPLLLSLVPLWSPASLSLLGRCSAEHFHDEESLEGHAAVVEGRGAAVLVVHLLRGRPRGHLEGLFDALERLQDQHAVCLRAAHLFIIKKLIDKLSESE